MNSHVTMPALVGRGPERPTAYRLLAVDLNSRGFGFAVFEDTNLIDWGLAIVPPLGRNDGCLLRFRRLVRKYLPDRVILEDMSVSGNRRSVRIRALSATLALASAEEGIMVKTMPWSVVPRYWFDEPNKTRFDVASEVAQLFPEIMRFLPKRRRAWDSQNANLSIFNATAFALAFICIYLARTPKNKKS